jgi:polysaccharide biosynthesis transport protein
MLAPPTRVAAFDVPRSESERAGSSPTAGLLDARGFGRFLRRQGRLIGGVVGAMLLLALVALSLLPKSYTATAILLADPRQQRVISSESVLSGIGSDAAAVESQVEILGSTSLAKRVIADLGLDRDPDFSQPSPIGLLLAELRRAAGFPSETDEAQRLERIVTRFHQKLKVRRRGLTYVLEVTFAASDPEKAARIANAVAEAYLADQIAAKLDATRHASGWLNERLDQLRDRVRDAERAVSTYKAEHNIVDTGEGRSLADRQIAELNQQLILARARTAETRAHFEQVKQAAGRANGGAGLPESLQSPVVANLRSQYAQLAAREASLTLTYGPRHPDIAAIKAQLSDVSRQTDREIARIAAGLRNEYESAQSRERSLDESLTQLKNQSATINQASVRLRELEREAQASRAVLEQFLLRFRETSEQQSLHKADARLISPAAPPANASHPKSALLMAVAFGGSLVLGIGLAAVRENFAPGFRTVREVEDVLSLPVLGLLPLITPKDKDKGWRLRFSQASSERDRHGVDRVPARLSVDQPGSEFAEAVRAMVARLRPDRSRAQSRLLLVTSSVPDEGKSTVAANLAHAIARSGATTLLIDADTRNPCLTRTIGATRAPGLAEALRRGLPAKRLAQVDAASGLHILPSGQVDSEGGSDLLIDDAFRTALENARGSYDVVILDGPPLLPFADGCYLLDQTDLALLVVEWAKTERESVVAALETAGPWADKIAGVALNKVDRSAYGLYDGSYDYRGRR